MSRLTDADMLSPDRDYYENSYNSGYDAVSCQQIDNAPTVKAILLDDVKKTRKEIENKIHKDPYMNFTPRQRERNEAFMEVLDVLDKLIESEN